mmetsp:Transcript_13003/g.40092  ORF Transcript_13003/g.40092 Transcript_13003/m.40092 type:complete len:376 (+) Transcript_13003:432-1559(+)
MSAYDKASAPPIAPVARVVGAAPLEAQVVGVDAARSNMRDEAAAVRAVQHMGMPLGLAEQFVRSVRDFSYRFWIIDNSGSMGTNDGHRIVSGAGGRQGMVPCSRWEELGASISWHARLAVELGAWTEFRMLNPPSGAPQHVVVGTTVGSHDPASVQELRTIDGLVASPPTGRTPLCAQIRSVTAQIAARADELRATNTKACIVIASDGEATDGDIAAALRPLRDLPAWVVIRLCTDEDRVVQYWNQIDEDLELDMDVLDDLAGEAAEVGEVQPWLTYGAPLHRLREWGTAIKLFDLLDERPIAQNELKTFAEIIFGAGPLDGVSHPMLDWKGFLNGLDAAQKSTPEVWDPTRKRMRPWINMRKLNRSYGGACVIS